jgi:predicted transcriptional regulator
MDMTGWLEFFVEGLSTKLAEVRERGQQAIHRDVLIKKHGLSDRQAKAIGHILEHGRLDIQDFERLCPNVTRRTLQRDLRLMVDKGLVAEKATSPTDPTKHYVLVDIPHR